MRTVNYKIYPTLIDAYQRYLVSEADNAFEELLNKINRVPFISEAADKGTKFNELIDMLIMNDWKCETALTVSYNAIPDNGIVCYEKYEFKKRIVDAIYKKLLNSYPQLFVQAMIPTKYGDVSLYGYIDNVLLGSPIDIKTTGKYEFPKYLHNWQHIVYPYCLIHGEGVTPDVASNFSYLITDFNNVFQEDYIYNEARDVPKLVSFIERFIEFIEQHKSLITDVKLFAKDERKEDVQASV